MFYSCGALCEPRARALRYYYIHALNTVTTQRVRTPRSTALHGTFFKRRKRNRFEHFEIRRYSPRLILYLVRSAGGRTNSENEIQIGFYSTRNVSRGKTKTNSTDLKSDEKNLTRLGV